MYLLLLATMWEEGGWIAADDKIIAHRLGLDTRAWKARYKNEIVPLLDEMSLTLVGPSYTQKRLQKELAKAADLRAKRIANLGLSEAEYEANRAVASTRPDKQKRAQAGHRTGHPSSRATKPAKPVAHSPAIAQSSEVETTSPVTLEPPSHAAGRAAVHTERSGPTPHNVNAAALPPREAMPAMPTAEPGPLENVELQRKLVADGLKRPGGKVPSLSELVAELTGEDDASRKA